MQQQLAQLHRNVRHRKARECTEKADSDSPKWSELAYAHIVRFAKRRDGTYLAEEVIFKATEAHVPRPRDKRAWGSLFTKAVRNGVLKRAGVSKATRNCSWKTTYRRGA